MKSSNVRIKKEGQTNSKEREVERFFKEIGLEKEEDRDRFKVLGSDQTAALNYEIRFSNNTKTNNG